MSRVRLLAMLCSTAMIASCGSGGSSSGTSGGSPTTVVTPTPSPTPTPASTPTPSPSPTPTPSATGTFAALQGTVALQSANSGFLTNFETPQALGVNAYGEGVRYIYDATNRGIAVDNGPNSPSFVVGDITSSSADQTRYAKTNGPSLTITRPTAAAPDYVRFIDYVQPSMSMRILSLVGIPTAAADIPTSGIVSYSRTLVDGQGYFTPAGSRVGTPLSLSKSTLTLTIDYGRRLITTSLVLVGTPATGADMAIGTISGTVPFEGETRLGFSSSSYPTVNSSIAAGVLFGPQAREAGLIVSLVASGSGGAVQIVGLGAAGR